MEGPLLLLMSCSVNGGSSLNGAQQCQVWLSKALWRVIGERTARLRVVKWGFCVWKNSPKLLDVVQCLHCFLLLINTHHDEISRVQWHFNKIFRQRGSGV